MYVCVYALMAVTIIFPRFRGKIYKMSLKLIFEPDEAIFTAHPRVSNIREYFLKILLTFRIKISHIFSTFSSIQFNSGLVFARSY
jgi:hypothetical protein